MTSTINGNSARGNGILQNPLYSGRIIWNRVRMVRDPDTGRRVSRAYRLVKFHPHQLGLTRIPIVACIKHKKFAFFIFPLAFLQVWGILQPRSKAGHGDKKMTNYVDLTPAAQEVFEAFIRCHAKVGVSADYSAWWEELEFTDYGLHFELAARYSSTGNPVTISFGAHQCVEADDLSF